jgi:hypothetical protein
MEGSGKGKVHACISDNPMNDAESLSWERHIPFTVVKIHNRLNKNMATLAVHRSCDIHILELLLILLVHRFQVGTRRLLEK